MPPLPIFSRLFVSLISTGIDDVAFCLQIFSNGKYKSVEHRAVVNNAVTRISVVMANGPALDTVVRPAYKLVDEEMCPVAYVPMKYQEYLEMQQGNQIVGKTCLQRIQV